MHRHRKLARADLAQKCLDVWVVKGQTATQQRKQDNTAAPYITGRAVVALAADNFRTRIVWTAAAGLKHLLHRLQRCHTKVGNLYNTARAIQQQVFGLEVTVADAECMAVVHTKNDLAEVGARLVRAQAPARNKIVKELAARDVLHDQKELLACLIHVPETKQVRMLDQLHNDNLALYTQRKLVLFCTQITQTHAAVD